MIYSKHAVVSMHVILPVLAEEGVLLGCCLVSGGMDVRLSAMRKAAAWPNWIRHRSTDPQIAASSPAVVGLSFAVISPCLALGCCWCFLPLRVCDGVSPFTASFEKTSIHINKIETKMLCVYCGCINSKVVLKAPPFPNGQYTFPFTSDSEFSTSQYANRIPPRSGH